MREALLEGSIELVGRLPRVLSTKGWRVSTHKIGYE